MAYSPYFVGPYKVGLEKDLDSYLIPEDAFPTLENAYLWRGRIYKKGGYDRLGKGDNPTQYLQMYAGRIGIRDDILVVRAGAPQVYNAATAYNPIEPGSLVITDGVTTFIDDGLGGFTITPIPANGTVIAPTNYTTGVYNIQFNVLNNGAPVDARYFVKVGNNSPVMGLAQLDVASNIQTGLVAFDLTSAYQWDPINFWFNQTKYYKGTSNVVAWTGSNTDFFDTTNYQRAMFATNNVPGSHFYSITLIVTGGTTQVTTSVANNFQVGDLVYISNATIAAPDNLNGKSGLVTIAGNPFTVAINSAASGAYTAPSGVAWSPTLSKTAAGDGIRWFDGFTPGLAPATGWVNYAPPLDATATPQILQGCLLITPYKGYLVALNTVEGTSAATASRYTNRARWSQFGNVYYSNPLPAGTPANVTPQPEAWYQTPGRGGFFDAPTGEDIIGAEFIKDTLIVYFEQSTYKLTYTGNATLPFLWEKVNAEIGCTSTFSTVPFDKSVLSIGPNGAYGCDSVNIERIDRIIPDEVFTFHTSNNASKRIYGIRDFYSESVQWLYNSDDQDPSSLFPTKSLYYNYVTNSYSIFKNTFTCFGHYNTTTDETWNSLDGAWNDYGRNWNSFISQSGFPIVVAGNPQGFVFQLQDTDGTLLVGNDQSLVIQSMTVGPPSVLTVPNHCIQPGDTITIIGAQGVPVAFNGEVYQVIDDANYTTNTFSMVDVNGDPVSAAGYTFGGRIIIVDNFFIESKNLNPFFAQGKSIRMGYADFYVDRAEDGEVSVQLYINDLNDESTAFNEQHTLSTVTATPANTKFWQRVYFNTQAQFINLVITFSNDQLFDPNINETQFVLHGTIFWMKPTGRLLDIPT